MGACALFQIREAFLSERPLSIIAAAALTSAAVGVLLIGRRRMLELQHTDRRAPSAWMIKVICACSVLATSAVGWVMCSG
ncbi:hypothetical protein [Pseudomonas sp. SA195]